MSSILQTLDKTITITPDTLLMKHLGSSGHTLIKALSELIDNALDSFLEHREELRKIKQMKLRVSIQIERHEGLDRIVVKDDAFGMSDEELHDSLTLARSAKPDSKVKTLVGRFGMGMKTASSSLAKEFEIKTCQPGDAQSYFVTYNEDEFIRKKHWEIRLRSEAKGRTAHGTTITLWNLKKKPQNKAYIKENLGRIFAFQIENNILDLAVQDEVVEPSRPVLLTKKNASDLTKAPTTRDRWSEKEVDVLIRKLKKIDFDDEGRKQFSFKVLGRPVEGWAGILKHSSQRGRYGFSLIRHDRVVMEEVKIGFAMHPSTARIVGEIHLDDWEVNYNKNDFIRDTEEWNQLTDELSEYLSDLVAISRLMATRQRGLSDEIHLEAEREGRKSTEVVHQDEFFDHLSEEVIEESLKRIGPEREPLLIKPITTSDAKEVQSRARASIESVSSVNHELEHSGARAPYVTWEIGREGKKKILVVRTNADHPFFTSLPENSRRWYYAFLIAECYAEHVQKEIGYDSLGLVKNAILAGHGPKLLTANKAGKDEFRAKLEEI